MSAERPLAELDQAELIRLREGYREATFVAAEPGAASMYSDDCARIEAVLDQQFPEWRAELAR